MGKVYWLFRYMKYTPPPIEHSNSFPLPPSPNSPLLPIHPRRPLQRPTFITPLMIPLDLTPLLPTPSTLRQFPLSFDTFALFLVWVLAVAEFAGFVVVEADAADPGAVG